MVGLAEVEAAPVDLKRVTVSAPGDFDADWVGEVCSEAWEVVALAGMVKPGWEVGCTAAGFWAEVVPMAEQCAAAGMLKRAAVVLSSVAGRDWAAVSGERHQPVRFPTHVPSWVPARAAAAHPGAAHLHARHSGRAVDWLSEAEASGADAATFSAA